MDIDLLQQALQREKEAREKAEQILRKKRLELYRIINELALANKKLYLQSKKKEKRSKELIIANKEKDNQAKELVTTNKKLAFQNEGKDRRTEELASIKVELEQQIICLNKAAIVSETDAHFNISFVNDNFCKIYGYQRDELIGQNHRILKSGKHPAPFFTDMISTISSGKVFKGKILNRERTGKLYWMDITVMPFKNLDGKIIKYVSIMFDINTQTTQKNILLKQADQLSAAITELAFQNKEKEKRADELDIANTELAFQNREKDNRAEELVLANMEKQKRADELVLANTELAFQNREKDNRADELILANREKEKRADELVLANSELSFQNKEKDNRAEELILANKEKEKRADELVLANTELAFQNNEKEKRADELAVANRELSFQNKEKDNRANELLLANEEKEKRADELVLANTELAFQNNEKEKRADELAIANSELSFQNKEKDNRADELLLANEEKEKRAEELVLANKELEFQNKEKQKRAEELVLANKELAFQNKEKVKRAEELVIANKELGFQNKEKQKRAEELVLANKELAFQNKEKIKRAEELVIADKELEFQNKEKQKRAEELVLANKELAFQTELDVYRSEMENLAKDLTLLIDTANAPIFGIDSESLVNEWNQTSEKITGFTKNEVLGKDLVQNYITEDYRESVKKVLDDALLGKETANYEFPLFTKDGRRVMVLLNSSTRRDAKGEITGVLGVGQDISQIDKLRTVSESIAKELRQFIETANAPIFGIDSRSLVNEWNQTSEKITGFTKDEVLGKDLVQNYITEDYRESVKKVLDDALQGKETANYEFPLFTKDGRRVMVLLNSSTRRDAKGEITGVLGVGQDITELVGYRNALEDQVNKRTIKLNEALEKQKDLNILKSRFVSTASHEFRTPLSSINFAAGSIKKYWGKMNPEMIEKKLEKIEDQVLHMTKLLDDVLVVGQAEAGKIKQTPVPVNLGEFISEIIEEVYSSFNKSHEIILIDPKDLKKQMFL